MTIRQVTVGFLLLQVIARIAYCASSLLLISHSIAEFGVTHFNWSNSLSTEKRIQWERLCFQKWISTLPSVTWPKRVPVTHPPNFHKFNQLSVSHWNFGEVSATGWNFTRLAETSLKFQSLAEAWLKFQQVTETLLVLLEVDHNWAGVWPLKVLILNLYGSVCYI